MEKIVKTSIYKPQKLALENTYSVDEYTGSDDIITGIQVTSKNQPVNYVGNDTFSGFSALLLNAKMYGSHRDNLCGSDHFPSDYWMQAGMVFNEHGWGYVVADTTMGCTSMPLELPEPEITDNVSFTIYGGSTWWLVLQNIDQFEFKYYSKSGMDSAWIQKGDESTSVFFETSYVDTGWDSQFMDGDLTMGDAQIKDFSDSWMNWDGDSRYVLDCYTNRESNNVISGYLKYGGDATWDISEMAEWTPNY